MAMIEMRDVSKWYGPVQVLKGCSTAVSKGEVVVVCGPSGSGKSTLIKTVNGLEPFQGGEVLVNGVSVGDPKTNLTRLRAQIGMVFQHFELFPHMSVVDNISLGQVRVLGRSRDEARARSMKLLERVGLTQHAVKYPGQLSGGQQQRVAVARAVGGQPSILLADEPTGNLDSTNGEAVMELLRELHRGGATICMVTHDPRYAQHADRIVHLFDGLIVEEEVGANRREIEEAKRELKESGFGEIA